MRTFLIRTLFCTALWSACILSTTAQLRILTPKKDTGKTVSPPPVKRINPVPPGEPGGGGENPTPECLTAFAGKDTSVCDGAYFQLGHATYNNQYVYSWSPSTELSSTSVPNPWIAPTQTRTYTLSVTPKTNLLSNGSFENGNTGFGSDFGYGITTYATAVYSLESSANNIYAWWCGTAPTHGSKMLVADGVESTGSRVWYETVSVTPNGNYVFSGQFLNIYNTNGANDPSLTIKINGVVVGTISNLNYNDCQWTQFNAIWQAGYNISSATIEIVNDVHTTGTGWGNDFAIDNLNFAGTDCVATMSQVTVNVGGPILHGEKYDPDDLGWTNTVTTLSDGEVVSCDHQEFLQGARLTATNVPPGTNLDWYRNGSWIYNGPFLEFVVRIVDFLASDEYTAKVPGTDCMSSPTRVTFVCPPLKEYGAYGGAPGPNGVYAVATFDYSSFGVSYPYSQSPSYSWVVNDPNVIWLTSPNQRAVEFTFPPNYHPGLVKINAYVTGTRYNCVNTMSWEHDYVVVKTKDPRLSPAPDSDNKPLLYPNPAKNTVTVSVKEPFTKIQLYAADGRVRKLYNRSGTTATIDIADLIPGTYFINIIGEKSIKTEKLIVVH